MRRYRGEDVSETFAKMGIVVAAIPIVAMLLVALVAGCFTVIWHIGHWVNWW